MGGLPGAVVFNIIIRSSAGTLLEHRISTRGDVSIDLTPFGPQIVRKAHWIAAACVGVLLRCLAHSVLRGAIMALENLIRILRSFLRSNTLALPFYQRRDLQN